jgi:hypothetical protein
MCTNVQPISKRYLKQKKVCIIFERRQDSVVGIATGYGLDDQGIGFGVPLESKFSLLHIVQTGSGAQPASYPMGAGALSQG